MYHFVLFPLRLYQYLSRACGRNNKNSKKVIETRRRAKSVMERANEEKRREELRRKGNLLSSNKHLKNPVDIEIYIRTMEKMEKKKKKFFFDRNNIHQIERNK